MGKLAVAAATLGTLSLLALPLRSSAGDVTGAQWGVGLDGGCRVRLDARPSTGLGCHVHFLEPDRDAGTLVEGIAAVKCDATFEVCGETVRCRCPEW